MKRYTALVSLLPVMGVVLPAQAEMSLDISGYGSIVAGKTFGSVDDPLNEGETRDEILTADFYDVGQYDNDIAFKPESVFALQMTTQLTDDLKITGQLVAKGTDDFEPEFDWYYLTYQATDELTLMAGRRNIPMYYYSEFTEVGYAYPWIRPPANLYWWQITQFDGFHASYTFDIGDVSTKITGFYGNEKSYDNKEMLYYERLFSGSATSIDEFWTDILGVNINFAGEWFEFRFVYFQNDRDRDRNFADGSLEVVPTFDQRFIGLGGSINLGDFTFLFDYNDVRYDDDEGTYYPTYMASLVYNIGDYQPYIYYSKADHESRDLTPVEEDLEEHFMIGYGVRYNFSHNAALKIQYDVWRDQGGPGWDYHGDSDTLAIALDFIF